MHGPTASLCTVHTKAIKIDSPRSRWDRSGSTSPRAAQCCASRPRRRPRPWTPWPRRWSRGRRRPPRMGRRSARAASSPPRALPDDGGAPLAERPQRQRHRASGGATPRRPYRRGRSAQHDRMAPRRWPMCARFSIRTWHWWFFCLICMRFRWHFFTILMSVVRFVCV